MGRLVVKRLLLSLPLVLIVSMLTFVMQSLAPGDPAKRILGDQYTPEQYATLRAQLGLDAPIHVRYWNWLKSVFEGSMGQSLYSHEPVTTVLNDRVGVTISLVAATLVVAGVIAIGLGILSAVRKNGVLARVVDVVSLAGHSVPTFWLGLGLVAVFSVQLGLFNSGGYIPPERSLTGWAWSLILPVATLSFGAVALIAKLTRDSMLEVLDREFITTLRARGVPERTIIFRHALRSAAIPIVTALGLLLVGLLSGTVIVETVFGLPGLGGAAVLATTKQDAPLIQGVAVYFTLIVVVVNLIIDILYAWLNPKARIS
ncbi:ABC transporter permease [Amycolatopsis pithecellobii]|uniref:ABC transporter permease subunit n=1 Tax=Amycolatopsis pithecellobii TaxID=664692 RepID=A0A6N7YWW7_9PSEU|nr:ABC transporter permease [Amycolatopsis pithecellobii]MTD57565.1 ABC transporter permease subunit [Amycolatopsis pithecellobii]